MPENEQSELARLTVELLSAFVSKNAVSSDDLPALIESTRTALAGKASAQLEKTEFAPAVSLEESLASHDHILSMIDGKPYRTLKRHLANNGLTPEEYRARYNLPASYPMVSPSYSEQRRAFAKASGLGGSQAAANKAPATPDAPQTEAAPSAKSGKPTAKKATASTAPVARSNTKASTRPSSKASRLPQATVLAAAPAAKAAAAKSKASAKSEAQPAGKQGHKLAVAPVANLTVAQEAKPQASKIVEAKSQNTTSAKPASKPSRRMARAPAPSVAAKDAVAPPAATTVQVPVKARTAKASKKTVGIPASTPASSELAQAAVKAPTAQKPAATKAPKAAKPNGPKPEATTKAKNNSPEPKKGRAKLGIKVPGAERSVPSSTPATTGSAVPEAAAKQNPAGTQT
ncbi:MucR family transcriptional regulator [Novosphingobium sp. BL-8A]|uniref:MucR family transcriptional regulator n=1 Tax=Novosphingobium sp. BL-8A TaxID=3127639 RepID=UPI0037563978